jgi:drug/metabolite transporter (DMT)-like permease
VSVVLALLAAVVFGTAAAVQQHEAARTEVRATLRPGLLLRLARRPIWLLGLGGDIGGFGLQTWALTVGSIVVVQPILSTNLLIALAASSLLARRPLRRRQVFAMAGTVGGLVVFLLISAPTAQSTAVASGSAWAALALVVGAVGGASLVVGWSAVGATRAAAFAAAAGLAEACMVVLAKAFGDEVAQGPWVAARSWTPPVLVAMGLLTLLLVQTSYQVGLPVVTLPIAAVVEPVVASLIGIALFDERLDLHGYRGPLVLGAATALAGSLVVLARSEVGDHPPRSRSGEGAST